MSRSARAGLLVVFIVAATARVGWVAVHHGRCPDALSYPDETAYQQVGRSLAAGHGLVDEFGYRATYMPAYPAFIALFERLGWSMLALRLTQAVLGAMVAPATYLLARQWVALNAPSRLDQFTWLPFLAGLATAVDPFLVFFSGLLLTETLFAALLIASWWLVMRLLGRRTSSVAVSFAAGLCLLGCVMLRPSSTIMAILAAAIVLIYRRFAAAAWLSAAVMLGVVLLGLFPWALRNHRTLGEWRWTTTRGGISLYDGLQPGATGASDLAQTKLDARTTGLGELQWDRYWHDRAVAAARQEPTRVLTLAGRKFLRMWNMIPNESNSRRGVVAMVSACWMAVVLITAGVGLWQVRRAVRWWAALLAPAVGFTLLHMIFVGSVRYRIPFMPVLFVLSATGLCVMLQMRRVAVHVSTHGGST